MSDQPALFDPRTTVPQTCPVPGCQAIRYPQQDRAITCMHDLQISDGGKRPRLCVNHYDPATAPWPKGF